VLKAPSLLEGLAGIKKARRACQGSSFCELGKLPMQKDRP